VLATALVPLLIAAADPASDVALCPGMTGGPNAGIERSAPDLVDATGEIAELGTSVVFTLRFADPLVVPDRDGRPFRIDIVMLDPTVPPVDAGLYRGVNRILRYDAVRDPVTTILLVPEGAQSRFIPPSIDGDTLVMQVPGRTLVADEDETGTSPELDRLRWGVVVRDERSCDFFGSRQPSERLVPLSFEPPGGSNQGSIGGNDQKRWPWPMLAVIVSVPVLVLGYSALRRRNPR